MTDTDETKRPKTLSLKKTETSTVKQSFSHGRTKAVVVEKKRTLGAPAPAKAGGDKSARTDKPAPAPVEAAKPAAAKAAAPARGVVLRQLSDEEKARRAAAIADARVSDSEARRQAEAEAARRAAEEELMKAERAAAEKRKSGKISRPMLDGVFCRTTVFNNKSGEAEEDKIERCDDATPAGRNYKTEFVWGGKR